MRWEIDFWLQNRWNKEKLIFQRSSYWVAVTLINVCELDDYPLEERIACNHGNNCTVGTSVWTVPGVVDSCVRFNSLFLSDLRCFFDQSCVNKFLSFYNYDMPDRLPLSQKILDIRAMNSSILSRYALNDSMATIFSQLLVEEWKIEGNFDGYFDVCAPTRCGYNYAQRLDVVYVVTTIVSLFGVSWSFYVFSVRSLWAWWMPWFVFGEHAIKEEAIQKSRPQPKVVGRERDSASHWLFASSSDVHFVHRCWAADRLCDSGSQSDADDHESVPKRKFN